MTGAQEAEPMDRTYTVVLLKEKVGREHWHNWQLTVDSCQPTVDS